MSYESKMKNKDLYNDILYLYLKDGEDSKFFSFMLFLDACKKVDNKKLMHSEYTKMAEFYKGHSRKSAQLYYNLLREAKKDSYAYEG